MVRLRRIAAVGVLAVAGAVPAAGDGAKATDPAAVDCETRLQLLPGRDPLRLHGPDYLDAGPVTFTAWARRAAPRHVTPPPGRRKRVKAPIFVHAGPAVTISLSAGSAERAEFEVGVDQGPYARGPAVRLTPCRRDATVGDRRVGPITAFIGGYRIDGPMCMRLEVAVDGRTDPIERRLAFGRGSCR